MITWKMALSLVGVVIAFISYIIIMIRSIRSRIRLMRQYDEIRESIDYRLRDISETKTDRLSVAQEKKEAIQKMGPKTFYYIDESQVKDLYPQIFQELEPKRIKTRESKETKKGIAAKLKLIEPKYGRGKAEETTKIYDVEQTPPIMFNKVEQYLLRQDKIIFGLEEFEFEKSSIDEFKSMCEQMQSKFDFNIPEPLQADFVAEKMKEFALQHTKKLAASSGYVAIQTEFSVIDILDDTYILFFVHPLNEYISQENTKVGIQINCAKKYMTSLGVGTFKKDKSAKITCLGKVVNWNDEDKIVELCPIAIY